MFLYKVFLVYYQMLKIILGIHCEKICVPQNYLRLWMILLLI